MNKKLGLRPAPMSVKRLKFSNFLGAPDQLPSLPSTFGHYASVHNWGMLGNDTVGDCGVAGPAHATMLWNAAVGIDVQFVTSDVLADYSAISGYVQGDDATDVGTDMVEVAKYWQEIGLRDASGVRHHISAELVIDPKNVAHVMLAGYMFGVVGLGVDLPGDAETQFDRGVVWQLTGRSDSLGLHYVPLVGRNSVRSPLCVTWGRLHAMTPEWLQTRLREAVVYISPEYISKKTNLTPDQFDMAKLQGALSEL